MEQNHLSDLLAMERKRSMALNELSRLTGEMADAFSRSDQVSLQMLLAMRQEPLLRLEELARNEEQLLLSLPEEDAIRANALLHDAEPATEDETRLHEQVLLNQKQLAALVQLDQEISVRMGGRRSFYNSHPLA